jgi:GNAT superfamily N-acetyltransferase
MLGIIHASSVSGTGLVQRDVLAVEPSLLSNDPPQIRRLTATDSIEELTQLLHAAYARLGHMGFNYTAVDQQEDVTRERMGQGECLVAVGRDERIVGTVLYRLPWQTSGGAWYDRPEVASFGQFAVLPALQSGGIGAQLLAAVEARVSAAGAVELALDTAEGATHLIAWYNRKGYRFVEYMQWPGKTYRSVVLSKTMIAGTGAVAG